MGGEQSRPLIQRIDSYNDLYLNDDEARLLSGLYLQLSRIIPLPSNELPWKDEESFNDYHRRVKLAILKSKQYRDIYHWSGNNPLGHHRNETGEASEISVVSEEYLEKPKHVQIALSLIYVVTLIFHAIDENISPHKLLSDSDLLYFLFQTDSGFNSNSIEIFMGFAKKLEDSEKCMKCIGKHFEVYSNDASSTMSPIDDSERSERSERSKTRSFDNFTRRYSPSPPLRKTPIKIRQTSPSPRRKRRYSSDSSDEDISSHHLCDKHKNRIEQKLDLILRKLDELALK